MDPNFIENSKQSIFSKGAESGSNQGHFLTLQIKFYNFYKPIIAIFLLFFFCFYIGVLFLLSVAGYVGESLIR